MNDLRIVAAGDAALLFELDAVIDPQVNARAIAIAAAVREAHVAGVRDVVQAYRSVAVYFDPLATDRSHLESLLRTSASAPAGAAAGRIIEVPVVYGGGFGPDLAAVAAFAGVTEDAVVELHAGRAYRVFMLGFLPGFPYLGVLDARIAVPRHASARVRVPAGSVGLAGQQTGIYPRDSPGGWQIVGRTPLPLFDSERTPPALFAPGDTVRFVPTDVRSGFSRTSVASGSQARRSGSEGGRRTQNASLLRRVTVVRAGLLTTIQDTGRWGHQSSGVPVAGPMDPFSHRLANALVGNGRDAAALEITLAGPELRFEHDVRLAFTGADLEPALDGAPLPMNRVVIGRAGSVMTFGARRRGARGYLALGGGVSVPAVLGSRATHVVSGLGGVEGRALRAGDTVLLGADTPHARARSVVPGPPIGVSAARLRVLPGPQQDLFPPAALDLLQRTRFVVAPESDRMGYRLSGGRLPTIGRGEMVSTSTFTGGIQVPPSGTPVLLMADRQTTGGYPQLATVITADLPAAGQLAPGDEVQFEVCTYRDAIAALVRQEGILLAVE